MDTASPPAYRDRRWDRRWPPLLSLALLALALLCVVAFVLVLQVAPHGVDPTLAPFRWLPLARDIA